MQLEPRLWREQEVLKSTSQVAAPLRAINGKATTFQEVPDNLLLSLLHFTNTSQKEHNIFPKQIQTSQTLHRTDEERTVLCAFLGSSHPEKLLAHSDLVRRSILASDLTLHAPAWHQKDPEDPESLLLRGMHILTR